MTSGPEPVDRPSRAATLEQLATAAVRVGAEGEGAFAARELIIATGADRIRFLHGIVTGDVAGTAVGPLWLVRARELGVDGYWIAGDAASVAAANARLAAAGVPALSPALAEVARVAAVEPKVGAEITGDYFPMELGLDDAIDYSKG